MTKFFYLHGFNSGFDPSQEKIQVLSKLGEVIGRTTNYLDVYDVDRLIDDLMIADRNAGSDEIILVGTSLGAYFARWLSASLKLRLILINPSLTPWQSLVKSVGEQKNYKTGETYQVTESEVLRLKAYNTPTAADTLTILATDDEVIDYRIAEAALRYRSKIVLTEGGHRLNGINKVFGEIQTFVHSVPANNANI